MLNTMQYYMSRSVCYNPTAFLTCHTNCYIQMGEYNVQWY